MTLAPLFLANTLLILFNLCYSSIVARPKRYGIMGDAVATCFPRSSYEFHSVARRRLGTLECCVFRSDLLLMPSGSLTFQNEKKADAFCPCIFMFGVLGHGAYAGCEIASHTFFSSR